MSCFLEVKVRMTSELRKCLGMLFRYKGKQLLSEREFVYAVSMDLHWFSPKEAQRLLETAMKSGLLHLSDGMLAPSFELSDENMPIDYRPSKELLKMRSKPEKKNLFMELVKKISSGSKLSKKAIVSRINKTQEWMGIDAEVAALVVARSLDIDIDEDISVVELEMLSRVK